MDGEARGGVGGGAHAPPPAVLLSRFFSEICVDTQVDVEMSNFTLMLKCTQA